MESSESEKWLFALLRASLRGSGSGELPPVGGSAATWEEVCGLAARQGVLGVVWEELERLPVCRRPPTPLWLRWAFETGRIEQRWRRQRRAVARLAAFYSRHGIPMMLLKGYALSLCYPVPEHRPCGDVDIWLFGSQPVADAVLTRELGIEIDTGREHHTVFRLDDIPVENHRELLDTRSHASNARFELLLRSLAAAPEAWTEVEDVRVYLPSPTFQALFLLRHAAVHFAGCGIRLRHFVDWTLFVASCHDRVDWPLVEEAVRESGMGPFADAFRAICIDRLGLNPAWIPPVRRNPLLERRMLEAVLHPPLPGEVPRARLAGIWFRLRRWWARREMYRMVYDESLLKSFPHMVWRHLRHHLPFFREREADARIRGAVQVPG